MKLTKFLSAIAIFFLTANPVFANDFATQIHKTYTITSTGANVDQKITITNLNDLVFPKSFTLHLYSDQLNNFSITDSQNKPAKHNLSHFGSTTKVEISFSTPIVGKNKSQAYQLSYTHPKAKPDPNFPQYIIEKHLFSPAQETVATTIIIPKTICDQPIIYPSDLTVQEESTFKTITLEPQRSNPAVSIFCQPKRYLETTLGYNLSNPSLTPIETQIALPPDTSSQKVIFHQITPEPIKLTTDIDGNRIATYKLEPKQAAKVEVITHMEINPYTSTFKDPVPDQRIYTNSQSFWPTTHPKIKQLAKDLTDIKSIYDYLVQHTKYNPDQFSQNQTRHGGNQIHIAPADMSGEDFTDAFITLARTKSIPSRRVVSFITFSDPKTAPLELVNSTLHAYPEWYDSSQQTWTASDPFWQTTNPYLDYWPNTDLYRITLVINGFSDSSPHPPTSITVKDIPSFSVPPPHLSATLTKPLLSHLLSGKTNLIITNTGTSALHQQTFSLQNNNDTLETISIDRLDINQQSIIPISSKISSSLSLKSNYGIIPITQSITTIPPTIAVTSLLATIAGIIAVITGRLLVHRSKR